METFPKACSLLLSTSSAALLDDAIVEQARLLYLVEVPRSSESRETTLLIRWVCQFTSNINSSDSIYGTSSPSLPTFLFKDTCMNRCCPETRPFRRSIVGSGMTVLSTLRSSVNPQAVAAAATLIAGVGLYIKVYGTSVRTWARQMLGFRQATRETVQKQMSRRGMTLPCPSVFMVQGEGEGEGWDHYFI